MTAKPTKPMSASGGVSVRSVVDCVDGCGWEVTMWILAGLFGEGVLNWRGELDGWSRDDRNGEDGDGVEVDKRGSCGTKAKFIVMSDVGSVWRNIFRRFEVRAKNCDESNLKVMFQRKMPF